MRGGCRRARRLDVANRRSTAGGRAEEIQRGRRKPSSKPRGQPMQSADRRRCNRRKIPTSVARDGELEKRGVRRGESRNGCLPPAGKFARGEMRCIAKRVLQRFSMWSCVQNCHEHDWRMDCGASSFAWMAMEDKSKICPQDCPRGAAAGRFLWDSCKIMIFLMGK